MSEKLKFELIRSRTSYLLHLSGFLYYKNSDSIGAYWLCKEAPECDARATTKGGPDNLELVKGSPEEAQMKPFFQCTRILKIPMCVAELREEEDDLAE